MPPSILVVFALFVPASTSDVCASGQSCDNQDTGEDTFTAAQLRAIPRQRKKEKPPSLGLLQLDGYYWPTQPGDINDLRTFCAVDGVDGTDYKCNKATTVIEDDDFEDYDFSLRFATIMNGTWAKVQNGNWSPALNHSFTEAVRYFLKQKDVKALMGNAGWFTWYQYPVSTIMRDLVKNDTGLKRKPWLGGSPAMLAAVGNCIKGIGDSATEFRHIKNWSLLNKTSDRIMLLTSNTKLGDDHEFFLDFLESIGIPAKNGTKKECKKGKKGKKSCELREVRRALRQSLLIETVESDRWTEAYVVFLRQLAGLAHECDPDTSSKGAIEWVRKVTQQIILVPWEDTLGYGIAVTNPGALFHNVPATIRGSSHAAIAILKKLYEAERNATNVVGIIMESTEMPAYSNWVRNITGLPVWDSTVVGRCLIKAADEYNSTAAQEVGNGPTLFNTPSFHDCMMYWWNSSRYEKRAGYQANGEILHYDNLELTTEQLDKLTCTGGRPQANKSIGRLMEQFNTGMFGPRKVAASCLTVTPCGGRTWQGTDCPSSQYGGMFSSHSGCFCEGNCPGGYYCGGDEEAQATATDIMGLEGIPGARPYVYGIRGHDYYPGEPSPRPSPEPSPPC